MMECRQRQGPWGKRLDRQARRDATYCTNELTGLIRSCECKPAVFDP